MSSFAKEYAKVEPFYHWFYLSPVRLWINSSIFLMLFKSMELLLTDLREDFSAILYLSSMFGVGLVKKDIQQRNIGQNQLHKYDCNNIL